MWYFDNQITAEWLPPKLCHCRYTRHERVLIASQTCVGSEAQHGAITKDRLVKDLEEVHPDQDGNYRTVVRNVERWIGLIYKVSLW